MPFCQNTLLADNGQLSMIVIALVVVVIFWFFILSPQQNQKKEEEKFAKAMKIGDKVVTIGGMHGSIVDMNEHTVLIQMMYNDAQVLLEKQAISPEATKNRYKPPEPPATKKNKGTKGKSKSSTSTPAKSKK